MATSQRLHVGDLWIFVNVGYLNDDNVGTRAIAQTIRMAHSNNLFYVQLFIGSDIDSSVDVNQCNHNITKTVTAVGQAVACAPVTQRARVRSLIGTSFLGEVFLGFFLTCKTNVRKL